MKYIKTLSVALLVAASTQIFAADDTLTVAAADKRAFAQRLINSAGRDLTAADITNDVLTKAGMTGVKGMSVLARVRAEFDAGKTAGAAFVGGGGGLGGGGLGGGGGLHMLAAGEHTVPAGHAITPAVVTGVAAGTHFIATPAHGLTAADLTGLSTLQADGVTAKPRTHHVIADTVLTAEQDARAVAEGRLAALSQAFDRLYADALSVMNDPALAAIKPARKAALLTALGFEDAEATHAIQALITAIGGNIVTKTDTDADQPAMDAAAFLDAVKNGGFDEDHTFAALHAAHGAHQAEIDRVEFFTRKYIDFA